MHRSRRKRYDLFITHAWRHHDDWVALVDLLDTEPGVSWRNFSQPWYDPAFPPHTCIGDRIVRQRLEQQITPAMAVILLSGLYTVPACRPWLDLALACARRHGKPIIAVPPRTSPRTDCATVRALADVECAWQAGEILAVVDRYRSAAGGDASTPSLEQDSDVRYRASRASIS